MCKKISICLTLLIMIFSDSEAFCAEKAVLVTQPAYHSMNFYVYKPANIPSEFYATYDGYLVYKNAQGIWHYASVEKSGIKKTGYVVGSVIPSVVKLKPYNAKISSVAPILGTDKVPDPIVIKPLGERFSPNEAISIELNSPEVLEIDVTPITAGENKQKKSQKILYTPPASNLEIYNPVSYTTNEPEWIHDSNFMAISKWQNSIDRMGMLESPKTPVAWKGDYPEVIYAWTGLQWWQISAHSKHISALNTLRRESYSFIVHTNKLNALNWNNDDINILSQYAMSWGYQWLGQISISKE